MALPTFRRITEIVRIQSGTEEEEAAAAATNLPSDQKTQQPPQTILLLSWGDAQPKHIAKYTSLYTTHWPTATIILVQSGMIDFFWRSARTSAKLIAPVVRILSEVPSDRLLVHVMSNAGSRQWCTIDDALSKASGGERSLAEAKTLVDSAPGRATFRQTWAAVVASLPKGFLLRWALKSVLGLAVGFAFLNMWIRPKSDPLEKLRMRMNVVPEKARGVRRGYVYSEQDELIGFKDVEEHALDAREKGLEVEVVKFEGSVHVGHLRHDPERYWRAIEGVWFGKS
jgi:hypothetical protein